MNRTRYKYTKKHIPTLLLPVFVVHAAAASLVLGALLFLQDK